MGIAIAIEFVRTISRHIDRLCVSAVSRCADASSFSEAGRGVFFFFFLGQRGKSHPLGFAPAGGREKGRESLRGSLKIFLRSAGLKIEEANAARIPTHRGSSWRCCGRAVIKTASAAKERNETGRKRIARARIARRQRRDRKGKK